jgi:hypothetical protein
MTLIVYIWISPYPHYCCEFDSATLLRCSWLLRLVINLTTDEVCNHNNNSYKSIFNNCHCVDILICIHFVHVSHFLSLFTDTARIQQRDMLINDVAFARVFRANSILLKTSFVFSISSSCLGTLFKICDIYDMNIICKT